MSEQEKKSGSGAGGSSVVLVEQPGSRHKQPFRPNELQEDTPDLPHKRSRAPAVSSVTEELKDNANSEGKDRREYERAMSSEKQKQSIAKKLSSGLKRRGSSPEAITLAQLEVDTKKGAMTPPSQPIPEQVSSIASADSDLIAQKTSERKEEDDSINDEIAELRTPEVVKKSSEWSNEIQEMKTKEVSWHEKVYFETSGAKSRLSVLERKSSIGPCFRSSAPYGRPSGIAICLSDKYVPSDVALSTQNQAVINITVSKKCLINRKRSRIERNKDEEQLDKVQDLPRVNFFGTLKDKLSSMTEKIRDVLTA